MKKACTWCGDIKNLADFGTAKKKDGTEYKRAECKSCKAKARKGYKRKINAIDVAEKAHHFCSACKTEKPSGEFHARAGVRHGLAAWCKQCIAAYNKRDDVKDRRNATRRGSKALIAYSEKRKGSVERRAQTSVNNALACGRLIKHSVCCICGSGGTEAHHDDYTKPLDVRWLCKPCHTIWHMRNEPIRA